MENASKALIIAGAVLIAIVIITIGVQIISSQKSTIDQGEKLADTIAVKSYNATFEKYAGIKKGSEVTNLLTDIRTNNSMTGSSNTITVQYNGTTYEDINDITAIISPIKNYRIDINSYANGYVSIINIRSSWT